MSIELSLMINHIDASFEESEYIPCHSKCPSCKDSCPCRRGYRKGLFEDDDCVHCYPPNDPGGRAAIKRAVIGLSVHDWTQREIAERLFISAATANRVLNG